jgi:hypothetical protein
VRREKERLPADGANAGGRCWKAVQYSGAREEGGGDAATGSTSGKHLRSSYAPGPRDREQTAACALVHKVDDVLVVAGAGKRTSDDIEYQKESGAQRHPLEEVVGGDGCGGPLCQPAAEIRAVGHCERGTVGGSAGSVGGSAGGRQRVYREESRGENG